jgi:hypothetical protein
LRGARDKATLTRGKASETLVEAINRLAAREDQGFQIVDDRSGGGEESSTRLGPVRVQKLIIVCSLARKYAVVVYTVAAALGLPSELHEEFIVREISTVLAM